MRRRNRHRLTGTAVLIVAAGAIFGLGLLLQRRGLDWADKFGSAASLMIAAVALLHPLLAGALRWVRGTARIRRDELPGAGADLAAALGRQLAREDRWRRTHDPRPLPVRWRSADGAHAGSYADIADRFLALPGRRLVILGPAGAGKTVLVLKLARDLLARRAADDPVPVVLDAVTWRREQSVTSWIETELIRVYPELAALVAGAGEPVSAARWLAGAGILPIVDGLDELPEPLRVRAIADLNAHGSDHPLVLTCRVEEFEEAVRVFGRPVAGAATVTVCPLGLEDAEAYLREATGAGPSRWQPVFDRLAADPDLAAVLTNPLMLWLARAGYEAPGTDPARLNAVGDAAALEAHLLGQFVPAVYRPAEGRPGRWRADRAEAWLRHQAAWTFWDGDGDSAQEVAWWRLRLGFAELPVWAFGVVRTWFFAASAALGLAWLAGAYRADRAGFAAFAGRHVSRAPLGEVTQADTRWADEFVKLFVPHPGEAALWLLPGGTGSIVAWTAGLAVVVGWRRFLQDELSPRIVRPRWGLIVRNAGIAAAIVLFLAMFPVPDAGDPAGLLELMVIGVLIALVAAVPAHLVGPAEATEAPSPAASLRADRVAGLAVAATRTVLYAGLAALFLGWLAGVVVLAIGAALVAVRRAFGSRRAGAPAHERLAAARLVAGATGTVPWRVGEFLADAHARGVLRQSGAVYRFRHLRLLEHLAGAEAPYEPFLRRLEPVRRRVEALGSRAERYLERRRSARRTEWLSADGVRVVQQGLSREYLDPRADRWPRPEEPDAAVGRDMAIRTVDLVVSGSRALGRRPGRWRIAGAVAVLIVDGAARARRYLARHAEPLEWPDDLAAGAPPEAAGFEWPDALPALPGVPRPDGEAERHELRPRPVRVVRALAAGVAAALALAWITVAERWLWPVTLLAGLSLVWWVAYRAARHATDRAVVTDRRVIVTTGLLRRHTTSWRLAAITDAGAHSGPVGGLLDYGTLSLAHDPTRYQVGYTTSVLGRLLGYARLEIGFGDGSDTELYELRHLRDPARALKEIVDLVPVHT
ncbi:PH domain-containing protein [Dactylosporangium sp. NPDC049140]|uniref:PH domain-containing protein n=1 Tax=Dactylosporangium sp. NPDC049140 TaxID=3155647 RepID=UPI0033DD8F2F